MSSFMKAAARCDLSVADESPVPIDAGAIWAEQQRNTRPDTPPRGPPADEGFVARMRRSTTDERMEQIRTDRRRAGNVQARELRQQSEEETRRVEAERVERERVEGNRAEKARQVREKVEAEERGRADMLRKHHSQLVDRSQRELRALEEKIGGSDPSALTQFERVRVDRERSRRIEAAMGLTGSVMDLYRSVKPEDVVSGGGWGKLAAERLQSIQRSLGERRRRVAEQLQREEEAEAEEEASRGRTQVEARKRAADEFLSKENSVREAAAERALREEEAEEARRCGVHPIDVLQRLIADERDEDILAMMAEEAEPLTNVERLDAYRELEADAWRRREQILRQEDRLLGKLVPSADSATPGLPPCSQP
eukprot:TRINITY_DN44016_c0_g1_i1.p1 TRINITY_DN44016_c0_g1~~TRINITY_DN44016_c0_g1_i1.p1  ORF type:complete len:368 (+),score=102.68 TRINITY_DN44016_c0_g1_i1:65-1168(+)